MLSEGKPENWKSKYIRWYRCLESIFGNQVPHVTDEKIVGFVSEKDWIIIPISGETDKKDSRLKERPNLWFNLSEKNKISLGIVYDKINSVRRLRNILSPFQEKKRRSLIEKLRELDEDFLTIVYRKIKRHHWAEAPDYERAFEHRSNQMSDEHLIKNFDVVEEIMAERNLLEEGKKYQLAPSVEVVYVETSREENDFKDKLSKIKPIYDVVVKVKTEEELEKEREVQKRIETKEKQEAYRRYIEELR